MSTRSVHLFVKALWVHIAEPPIMMIKGTAPLLYVPEATKQPVAESAPSDVTVLGIDGKTCCGGVGHQWEVLGEGGVTVYREGGWRRFTAGEALTL